MLSPLAGLELWAKRTDVRFHSLIVGLILNTGRSD